MEGFVQTRRLTLDGAPDGGAREARTRDAAAAALVPAPPVRDCDLLRPFWRSAKRPDEPFFSIK